MPLTSRIQELLFPGKNMRNAKNVFASFPHFLLALTLSGPLSFSVFAFDLKLPLPPSDKRYTVLVTWDEDVVGYTHENYVAIDFDDGEYGVGVLAAAAGTVRKVVNGACDSDNRDICIECTAATIDDNIAVKYDPSLHQKDPGNGYGNHVILEHPSGFSTLYAHLSCAKNHNNKNIYVEEGQAVERAQPLGNIGTSGASWGTHLHFEVGVFQGGLHSKMRPDDDLLQQVTMEGYPLTDFERGQTYPSTNYPGVQVTNLEISNAPLLIDSKGTYSADIAYAFKNNTDAPVSINRVTFYGTSPNGTEFLLGEADERIALEAGEEASKTADVLLQIPDNQVGDYRVSIKYDVESPDQTRTESANRSASVYIITDERSRLVTIDSDGFTYNPNDLCEDCTFEISEDSGFAGDNTIYTFSDRKGASGSWQPPSLAPGRYRVQVFIPRETARTSEALYKIHYAPSITSNDEAIANVLINQLTNQGRWVRLDNHTEFAMTDRHGSVTLATEDVMTPGYKVGFDAAVFEYTAQLDDFLDISVQDWFYEHVRCLASLGIVKTPAETTDRKYKPHEVTTRAELLKMALEAAMHSGDNELSDLFKHVSVRYIQRLYELKDKSYPPFDDVSEDDWFHSYVSLGVHEEIVSGYEDGSFRPQQAVTRADGLKMVLEAFDVNLQDGDAQELEFSDVIGDEWYVPYIKYAQHYCILKGFDDGLFRPNDALTRAGAAKLVNRAIFAARFGEELACEQQEGVCVLSANPR